MAHLVSVLNGIVTCIISHIRYISLFSWFLQLLCEFTCLLPFLYFSYSTKKKNVCRFLFKCEFLLHTQKKITWHAYIITWLNDIHIRHNHRHHEESTMGKVSDARPSVWCIYLFFYMKKKNPETTLLHLCVSLHPSDFF